MRNTFNRNQKVELEFSEAKRIHVSTVSIPEKHMCDLDNISMNRELHLTLRILLEKFRKFIALGQIPKSEKVRVKYQKKGQDLVNVKFRPWDRDWAELGILAYGLGVSRCWLFTYMLELEFSLLGDFLELPEVMEGLTTLTNSTPRNIWQLSDRKEHFIRILHFRV